MNRDEIFNGHIEKIEDFKFNEEVAHVFDDMVSRSIPNYHEVHKIILDLLRRAYKRGKIYDLGCSTGTTLYLAASQFRERGLTAPEMEGIDNSTAMLEKARLKLKSHGLLNNVTFSQKDLTKIDFDDSGMVIMNYTLQFLPMHERLQLLSKIYDSLLPGGLFVLAEKINCDESSIDHLVTDLYYDFKRRNGYSEMEIANKREALENVLKPLRPNEQITMLKQAGFNQCEMIFRWYNFCLYLGVKDFHYH